MEKTNYEKVLEFNEAFGIVNHTSPQLDIFSKNKKLLDYRMSLVTEEYNELVDAVKKNDFVEIIDGATDSLFVLYGFFTALGIDGNDAFQIVHKSNMSKLCKTEEEAIESVKRYKQEVPQRYDSPNYKLANDNKHYIVYNESTMKILKSYLYTPANFDALINVKN
jgi:predicted HAD superfamily Cof-like phosphohydrolase